MHHDWSLGCTPGYWKNHSDFWPPTGYSPAQSVASVFGQAAAYPAIRSASLLVRAAFLQEPAELVQYELLEPKWISEYNGRMKYFWLSLSLAALSSAVLGGQTPTCVPSETALCLLEGRFQVEVDFSNFEGNQFSTAPADASGSGRAVPHFEDSGFFWFFQDDQYEILVRMRDGRAVNGNFWVFAAATTNVEYTLRITDTQTQIVKSYFNAPGDFTIIADTQAFPETATLSASVSPRSSPAALPDRKAVNNSAPVCSDATVLCLMEDRFRIEVRWKDFAANEGSGKAVPLAGSSGAFYFFSENNIEMLVKVLDGRMLNGHFWVFAASVTNVEYQVRVTDSLTGISRSYHNSLGASRVTADNLFRAEVNLAQFGGGGPLTTDLILFNTSADSAAETELSLFSGDGGPLTLGLAGIEGDPAAKYQFRIPPRGSRTLTTSGDGVGSALIGSDAILGVQVRYQITGFGAAAVGPGSVLRSGLVPVRSTPDGVRTGLAVLNVRSEAVAVHLTLLDEDGGTVAGGEAVVELQARERQSMFIDEFFAAAFPGAELPDFRGTVLIEAESFDVAVIALELAQDGFTSISVSPLP